MHNETTPSAEIEHTAAAEQHGSGWQATSAPGVYRRAGAKTYTVRWRGPDGRQRSKGGFRTQTEAKAFLAEQKTDAQRGEYRELSTVTLAGHVEQYIAEIPPGELVDFTAEEYAADLRRAVEYFGPKLRLVDLTTPRLVQYANHLRARGGKRPAGGPLSPRTVKRLMAPLSRMLGDASAAGLVRGNPVKDMPRARKGRSAASGRVRALTATQLRAMIEATPEGQPRAFVVFLAGTGLRVSEAIGLRWRNVDLAAGEAEITSRIRRGREGSTKSGDSDRRVDLSPGLVSELRRHKLASKFSGGDDFVFATAEGTHLSESNTIARWVKPAAKKAGIVDDDGTVWVGHHSLRHTFASHALAEGWTIVEVQKALGHATPVITLRTYAHFIREERRDLSFIDALTGVGAGG